MEFHSEASAKRQKNRLEALILARVPTDAWASPREAEMKRALVPAIAEGVVSWLNEEWDNYAKQQARG